MWEVLWIYEGPFLCIYSYSEVGRKTNHCPARFQAQNLVIKVSYIIWIICIPPWKTNMKPTNHPCKKEENMIFQTSREWCSTLIFRGEFQGFDLLHFGIFFELMGIDTRVFLRAEFFKFCPKKVQLSNLVVSKWNHSEIMCNPQKDSLFERKASCSMETVPRVLTI